jgi:hypothetical protein
MSRRSSVTAAQQKSQKQNKRSSPHDKTTFSNSRVLNEKRVDLSKLNAEASNLHLIVSSSATLHHTVWQIPSNIASLVEAVCRTAHRFRYKNVWQKLFLGVLWKPKIAFGHVMGAHEQLSNFSNAAALHRLVEHEQLNVFHANALLNMKKFSTKQKHKKKKKKITAGMISFSFVKEDPAGIR